MKDITNIADRWSKPIHKFNYVDKYEELWLWRSSIIKFNLHSRKQENTVESHLLLIDIDPINWLKPAMGFDIRHSILKVAISLGQVNLKKISQQIFQLGSEMRRKTNLE